MCSEHRNQCSLEGPVLVKLKHASFGYNGTWVLKDISLSVMKGEFAGLIGPNGAGKTTLFRGLVGLIKPKEGSVIQAPEIVGRLGYVPQRDRLDPIFPLTAYDIVRLGLVSGRPWYRPIHSSEHRRIEECLEQVGMTEHRHAPFSQLSGGQLQRILIARALVTRPSLLVLDEPTAGIDPLAEENILELLARLHQEHTMTILMVSHRIPALRGRVDRIIAVHDQTVDCGPAEEMLAANRVAELMGGP